MKPYHFANRFNVSPGKRSVFLSRKEQVIKEFNDAVEKGASEQFLTSLYNYSKGEIAECNGHLNLLPQDGLKRLNWTEAPTNEQIAESFKIAEEQSKLVKVLTVTGVGESSLTFKELKKRGKEEE